MAARARRRAHDFRAGDIVGSALEIWIRHLIPFGLLSLAIHAPLLIAEILDVIPEGRVASVVEFGAGLFLGQLLSATLVYAVFKNLRSEKVNIGACVRRGLSALIPVVGVAVASGLLILLSTLLPIIGFAGASGPLTILGILLLVPAVMLSCTLWVAVPVAVVERTGLRTAVSRSAQLTKGYRWRILLALVLMLLLQGLIGAVFGLLLGVAAATLDSDLVLAAATTVITILCAPLSAVTQAVGYYHLRLLKEGLGAEDLAAVFE